MSQFDLGGFDLGDVEASANRAVEQITLLARRAARFATWVLLFVVVSCVGGFLLGLRAFGADARGWWLLGGLFLVLGVGAALVGRWRVGSARRHVPELVGELRQLIGQGRAAGGQVLETFSVTEPDGTEHFEARLDRAGAFGLGRTLWSYKGIAGSGTEAFARLTATFGALTSYPVLALGSVLIGLVFLGLSVIFAVVLVL